MIDEAYRKLTSLEEYNEEFGNRRSRGMVTPTHRSSVNGIISKEQGSRTVVDNTTLGIVSKESCEYRIGDKDEDGTRKCPREMSEEDCSRKQPKESAQGVESGIMPGTEVPGGRTTVESVRLEALALEDKEMLMYTNVEAQPKLEAQHRMETQVKDRELMQDHGKEKKGLN